jgi:hypothetical protein
MRLRTVMTASAWSKKALMDVDPASVAARESMEGLLPGVGALYVPAPGGLDGSFLALVCDPPRSPRSSRVVGAEAPQATGLLSCH